MNSVVPLLEARSVSKTFAHIPALVDVDLAIAQGEWTAIVGPSGSGKTTLLQLLGSLEVPDRGSVLYKGRDLAEIGDLSGFRRRAVGMVYQLHNLLPHLDVAGNVEVALYGSHLRGAHRAARVAEVLEQVALTDMHDRKPPELSGGERQRVAIARAIANDPEVLLADEPTGSLDPRNVERLVSLFMELKSERSMSVVMVTHDRQVARMADRVLVLEDGRLESSTSNVDADRLNDRGQIDMDPADGWDASVP